MSEHVAVLVCSYHLTVSEVEQSAQLVADLMFQRRILDSRDPQHAAALGVLVAVAKDALRYRRPRDHEVTR